MSIVRTNLIGRFGNQLFQWAHAKAFAVKNGRTLATPPWVGEKIFDISEASRSEQGTVFGGYHQDQESIIYSRKDVLNWLKINPNLKAKLDAALPKDKVVAHLRRGDYGPLGYVVVSQESYRQAAKLNGFNPDEIVFLSENNPTRVEGFEGELSFLPDFYRMMKAPVLFRANSSFSWWAATLGDGRVFSPVIENIEGGIESKDCIFLEGNWPRLANFDFTTNLHLFSDNDRYDYDLNSKSVVFDCGGYDGDFTDEINRRYGCNIVVFEPVPSNYEKLKQRFAKKSKIRLLNSGIGGHCRIQKMNIKGNMTGMFAQGDEFEANVVGIDSMLSEYPQVDLLKLNIEGMEFEVLERILELGAASRFKNIQVQFHGVMFNAQSRYADIREKLMSTHRLTYDEPFCWQNFERRQ